MLDMDLSPGTNFEKEVVVEDETRFILSTDNMSDLESLVAQVEYEEKSTFKKLFDISLPLVECL